MLLQTLLQKATEVYPQLHRSLDESRKHRIKNGNEKNTLYKNQLPNCKNDLAKDKVFFIYAGLAKWLRQRTLTPLSLVQLQQPVPCQKNIVFSSNFQIHS